MRPGSVQTGSQSGRPGCLPPVLPVFLLLLLAGMWTPVRGADNPAATENPGQTLSDVSIRIHGPGSGADPARFEELARMLIRMQAGDPFSETTLKAALDRLKDCGVFERIEVDSGPGVGGPVALTFDLVPFQLIRRVDVEGEFPLFEDEILNALGMRAGSAFADERLARGKKQLAELLAEQGLVEPEVDVSVHPEPADGSVALLVKIEKRGYYRLKAVNISGNRHFSDSAIRAKMKTWRNAFWPGITGRFLSKDLKRDIRDLVGRYRSSGFAAVRINPRVDRDPDSGHVTVALDIQEGPRFEVSLEGNHRFSDRQLKKELVIFKKGYRHGFGLRRSIRRIREKYRRAGYPRVRVTPITRDEAGSGEAIRRIRLLIDEGPLERVAALAFSGNSAIEDETLQKQMLTVPDSGTQETGFSPAVLAEDVQAIQALYRSRGFSKVEVQADVQRHAADNTVDVTIRIHEGVLVHVAAVEITGLPVNLPPAFRGKLRVRAGEPFRPELMDDDKTLIRSAIAQEGYVYARVTHDVAPGEEDGAVRVVYRVHPGVRTRLALVYIQGNFKTRPGVVLETLELKPGDPFSLRKMLASQSDLRDLEIFRDVRMQPVGLREQDRDIVLVVSVGERKPYFVELGAGFDTRRGLFGLLTLGDRNLWGSGMIAQAHLFASQIGYSGNLTLRKPNIFGTRFSADGRIFGERMEEFNKPFGTESFGASLGVLRSEWYDVTLGAKGGYQRRKQYQVDNIPIRSEDLDPRHVADATVFLQYDGRDSFLLPKKGLFSMAAVYFSHGLDSDGDDFLKYRLDTRYYWTPLGRLTFAMAARAGYIDMYGNASSPPDDQLFYLGGAADVRGFSENLLRRDPGGKAVGGRTMVSGTLEARIDVGYRFELITFLDTGMVGHPSNPESRGGFRFTAGLGLNYITPVGPIGLSYGYKLDRREGEDPGRIHFSIGYTF